MITMVGQHPTLTMADRWPVSPLSLDQLVDLRHHNFNCSAQKSSSQYFQLILNYLPFTACTLKKMGRKKVIIEN